MPNDASVTVRIPASLKKHLEVRARAGHRSLSAQVLHDLEAGASPADAARPGRFLGLYAGTPVPTDAQIREVRVRLWGRLNPPGSSDGEKPNDV